jgi:hypothetical protein
MGTGSVTHQRIIQEPKAITAAASFEKNVPGKSIRNMKNRSGPPVMVRILASPGFIEYRLPES